MTVACAFDVETTYAKHLGRTGSPFAPGIIGLCANGFLFDDESYRERYLVVQGEKEREGVSRGSEAWLESFPSLAGVDVLVGHNIKFDLLWYWRHPNVESFLKGGGVIWDTAYAEYLLSGQLYNLGQPEHLRPSLGNACKRRGVTNKLDVVKAMWEKGIRTEDVPEDVLMEYQRGDCVSTMQLYDTQLLQASRQRQMHMITQRMEGLLATIEMEYNGLVIDLEEAKIQQAALEAKLVELQEDLVEFEPEMPPELEFNWGSTAHLSALLFGGSIKYRKQAQILDADGNLTYFKKTIKEDVLGPDGVPVRVKSGKNAGMIKTKNRVVPDIHRGPKTRFEDFFHELPGVTKPHHKWKSSKPGQWFTKASVLEKLQERNLPVITALLDLRAVGKDLGTYYQKFYKGKYTGMLTMVDDSGFIHHNLNHIVANTTRLSSSKPNLQNLPKSDKSNVRKVFVSRFGEDGVVAEGDYSQLEVVCKGVLSGDKNLLKALVDGVCFHCDWLSLSPSGEGKSYEEIHKLCKIDHVKEWVAKRSQIKPLTFGEQFGAGVPSLCESTGMCAEDVEAAIAARKLKYPLMYQYDAENIASVKASRRASTLRTAQGMPAGIGYLRSATDTIFHFVEGDAPDWMKHRGIMTSFSPTTIKNYPSQGLGGEIMQVTLGRLFRWIIANDRFDDKLLLINTVHDCCWFDVHKNYLPYLDVAKEIMEDVSPFFNKHFPGVNWDTPFPVEFEVGPNFWSMEPYHA